MLCGTLDNEPASSGLRLLSDLIGRIRFHLLGHYYTAADMEHALELERAVDGFISAIEEPNNSVHLARLFLRFITSHLWFSGAAGAASSFS
jgi:hypothetical protein